VAKGGADVAKEQPAMTRRAFKYAIEKLASLFRVLGQTFDCQIWSAIPLKYRLALASTLAAGLFWGTSV